MPDSQVFYAERDGFHGLRFEGRISYMIGPSLEQFIRMICNGPKAEGFVVDLRDADSIDSTSLGLLVQLAKWMKRNGSAKVSLVSTRKDINDLLLAIGFDDVFDLVDDTAHPVQDDEALDIAEGSREETAKIVLDAHRSLVALSDENLVRFQDVVTLLERELDGSQHNCR